MTKFRKFIPVLVCSFLIAGGSVAAVQGINRSLAKEAQATTDCGNVEFSLNSVDSNGNFVYFTAAENDAPYAEDWSLAYYPVDNHEAVYLNGVDIGYAVMKKTSPTSYCLALVDAGHGLTQADIDVLLTLTGSWYCTTGGETYTFTVTPAINKTWSGLGWVDYYDTEEYDVVSLLDSGMPDFMGVPIDREAGYSRDNLYNNSFPITNNTGSFAFRFGYEALSDESGTITIRVGSNGSWGAGHTLRFMADNTWGPKGTVVLAECVNDAAVNTTGDIQVDLKSGAAHTLEFGIAKIKDSADYNAFVRYDGFLVRSLRWTLDATTPLTTRVGMYYTGSVLNITNKTTQTFGTESLRFDSMFQTTGMFMTTSYDLDPTFNSWTEHGKAYVESNISYNGTPKAYAADNYFKKHSERGFFLGFSDLGITPQNGDVLTIGGSFKFIHLVSGTEGGEDAVYKTIKISFAKTTFVYNGSAWANHDLSDLQESTESELEAGNLIANIGKWNPEHNKQCVKQFDQDADSLVYKKDAAGHTGVYFTNSNPDTHGEFRVYLPDNGYKSESKGYAMTQFSFDYILEDAGTPTETGRNHSLTPDGYYVPSAGPATNKFTLQVLCHNKDNMYFDYDIELINDGCLHTLTFNLAYSDVMGFCFVLWNFNGTFFMSNCHANYLEYNQALNELVYDSLKMYDYKDESGSCTSYYAGAKAAYEALTDTEKGIFNTEAAYGSARARLAAWALANGEVFDPISGTFTANTHGINATALDKNNVVVISIVIFAIALISAAGVMLVIKKRKYSK